MVQLSLDLLQEWLSKWGDNLLDLSENAGYVDFSGLKSFKIVSINIPCSLPALHFMCTSMFV